MVESAIKLLGNCDITRKSYEVNISDDFDPHFHPSLLRGIYEGDGCWTINKYRGAMDIRLASASSTFLQSVKSIIIQHCLETSLDVGRIRKLSCATACELIHRDKIVCADICEWFYQPLFVNDNLIMQQKYKRHLLLLKLYKENTFTLRERNKILDIHMSTFLVKKLNRTRFHIMVSIIFGIMITTELIRKF